MVASKITAIVLGATEYRDTSLVVKVLTKNHGILTVFGRNFRNTKNDKVIFMQRFVQIEFEAKIYKQKVNNVRNVHLLKYDEKIEQSFKINQTLNLICKIIDHIEVRQEDLTYELLVQSIKHINENNYSYYRLFWLIYLYTNKVPAVLNCCFNCKTRNNICDYTFYGGFLCQNCSTEIKTLKELKYFKKALSFDLFYLMNRKIDHKFIFMLENYLLENEGINLKNDG